MHDPRENTITLTEYVEIGSSGTTGIFGTDRFGRVQDENEAVLHVRGVLVPIIVEENSEEEEGEEAVSDKAWEAELDEALDEASEEAPAEESVAPGEEAVAEAKDGEALEEEEEITRLYSRVQLKDYSGIYFGMFWDTVEDRKRAVSPSKVNGVDLRALPCEAQQLDGLPGHLQVLGIVLRPDYEARHPTINHEIRHKLWVRCGSFFCYVNPENAKDFEREFAIERYGWTFETGFSDNREEKEKAYVHLAPTRAAPDLNDVFIL